MKKKNLRNTIEIDVSRLIKPTRLFVEHVIEKSNADGIRVVLKDKPLLFADGNKKFPIQGYFDDEENVLAVACRKRPQNRWLGVLAHESCHHDQLIEGYRGWEKTSQSIWEVDTWLEGKLEHSPSSLRKHVHRVQKLEHDCERRSIEKIIAFDLPIDIDEYTQQANAYVFFYSAVEHERKWCRPNRGPASTKKVWGTFPKYLLPIEEYEHITPKMLELFRTTM